MNRDSLLTLYQYNAYANHLVLDEAAKMSEDEFTRQSIPSHGTVHNLMMHMLAVEMFFLRTCQGQPFTLKEEDLETLSDLRSQWETLEKEQQAFIETLNDTDINREVEDARGLRLPIWQFLTQGYMSSQHHRGELSISMTYLGYPLPTLDIIIYFVDQSGQSWPEKRA